MERQWKAAASHDERRPLFLPAVPYSRQPALRILPAEMQLVHTRTRLRVPLSVTIRAGCRLGSHRRRDLLLA